MTDLDTLAVIATVTRSLGRARPHKIEGQTVFYG